MKSVLFLSFVLAAVTSHAVTVRSSTNAPPQPWAEVPSGLVNMEESLHMTMALRRNNVDKVEAYVKEVSEPASPMYGERMSHQEMKNLVSPGEVKVQKVVRYLEQHGATKVVVARHEDSINFQATVGAVANMLKVQFKVYKNVETKKVLSRALGAENLPKEIDEIVEVVAGHRGFPLPKTKRPKPTNPDGMSQNVTPSVINKVYNVNEHPKTPSGQTNIQSFFQAQGQYVNQNDLSTFCSELLPSDFKGNCQINKYVGHDGTTAGIESSLDSEYITATGYGLDTWAWSYPGVDFCQDLLSWGQDVFGQANGTYPYVISMSYGSQSLPVYCTGKGLNRVAQDVMKMSAMGISVIIASGDSGSGEFSRSGWNFGYLGVSFPAEILYATSVGATTFESGSSGTERAATFSGGGFSFAFNASSYQQAAIQNFLATSKKLPTSSSYNKNGRGTPDVSALGEGFYVISQGTALSVAGTSCSTPTFAGLVARLNNIRLMNNKTLGFLNPLLYKNPQGFTDITSGTNDMQHDGTGWYAQKGWDPVTGLGTPNFGELATIVKGINANENAALRR